MATRSPKPQSSFKRSSYTIEFKMQAVDWLRNGGNISAAARAFGVDRKRVREWDRDYEKFVAHNIGHEKKRRKLHPGRAPASTAVNQAVFEYLEE